ncbi:CHRD domain-containing protein [Lysobacter sp. LF1]|uniref:CHRD domain-containing protein n=1 Tax=Lysobacter stagni TaxID=3045172 RepID=A0ABT6XHT3_9GAMM|nr:CHRD domain-containing protein [Lysobacter sp. LF1]MDI9239715.1 CHRD domain-containing protein [Lysobacter sp. LF1]
MTRLAVSVMAALTAATALHVQDSRAEDRQFRAVLEGAQEVPALSTDGSGSFRARISPNGDAIYYELAYAALEGTVTQAHIHIGQKSVNGGIAVFLCTNLGNGPAGTQSCPAPPARITGVITAANVIGPAAQGVAAGELDEVIRALREGIAYANVHSTLWPGGEIRSQLGHDHD